MGTGKSGRYLNTYGTGRTVSDFAAVHSNEGTFIYTQIGHHLNRLASGGHGQANIDLMDRHHIEYTIVKTYSNGVRVGNVTNHGNKKKRSGTNQAWFPKTWTEKDIKRAGSHVAGLKENRHTPSGKPLYGVYKGVRVGIIKTNGKIATVFPDSDQSFVVKRRKRK